MKLEQFMNIIFDVYEPITTEFDNEMKTTVIDCIQQSKEELKAKFELNRENRLSRDKLHPRYGLITTIPSEKRRWNELSDVCSELLDVLISKGIADSSPYELLNDDPKLRVQNILEVIGETYFGDEFGSRARELENYLTHKRYEIIYNVIKNYINKGEKND